MNKSESKIDKMFTQYINAYGIADSVTELKYFENDKLKTLFYF